MVKIKGFNVFKYHKIALIKLRIYPTSAQNKINVFFKSFASYYILIVLIAFIISSIVFVVQNLSEFTDALRSCMFIFGVCQAIGMFYYYGINASKMQTVHIKLQETIDEMIKGKYFKKKKISTNNELHSFPRVSL